MPHDHKTMTFTDLYHFTNNTCDFGGGRITVSSVSYNQALCSKFGSSTNHPPTMQSPVKASHSTSRSFFPWLTWFCCCFNLTWLGAVYINTWNLSYLANGCHIRYTCTYTYTHTHACAALASFNCWRTPDLLLWKSPLQRGWVISHIWMSL